METTKEEFNKTQGFDTPTVFFKFTKLAGTTQSANLGHGFPDWQPPQFFLDSLQKHLKTGNFQYSNGRGLPKLSQAIADNYSGAYQRKINPSTEVLVTNGAVSPLYSLFTAYLNKGDEAVTLEPFYDCYLPPVKFVGASLIGVPLIPPKKRDRKEYENISSWKKGDHDNWTVDMELLKKSLNEKTKILVLNTPNNPTGKILNYEELKEIAKILEKFPKIIVAMDEVYEYNLMSDLYEELPRMSNLPGMWDRTVTIHSFGKIFSITGIRLGCAIGAASIIKNLFPIYQYSVFCIFEPYQAALADCLERANLPYEGFKNYYAWLRDLYTKQRNHLIENLAICNGLDVDFYLPDGGFFLICDISKHNPETKNCLEGDDTELQAKYTKDYKFLINMANEKHVVAIPCSALFTPENRIKYGQNYIRFAFCKKTETMDGAFRNFQKYS